MKITKRYSICLIMFLVAGLIGAEIWYRFYEIPHKRIDIGSNLLLNKLQMADSFLYFNDDGRTVKLIRGSSDFASIDNDFKTCFNNPEIVGKRNLSAYQVKAFRGDVELFECKVDADSIDAGGMHFRAEGAMILYIFEMHLNNTMPTNP